MGLFSIVLNLITIAIVAAALFFQGHNLEGSVRAYKPFDAILPMEAMQTNEYDPLVTGRAYFAESKTGNIGSFTGNDLSARYENWESKS